MIGVDRLRSGDPRQAFVAVFDYGKLIFLGAGGQLFFGAVEA